MSSSSLSSAVNAYRDAIAYESREQWELARDHYLRAAQIMNDLIEAERSDTKRDHYMDRMEVYISSAELMATHLPAKKPRTATPLTSSSVPSSTFSQRGGTKTERVAAHAEDLETVRLKEIIKSTVLIPTTTVSWGDIAGLADTKAILKQIIRMNTDFKEDLTKLKIRPTKGILLYGPPGTGKSMLASAMASACGSTFYNVSAADINSKYVGDSEKIVKHLFEMARETAPSIIFIDEIDSMLSTRKEGEHTVGRNVKTVFITQMDGINKSVDGDGVLVLGATNRPDELDDALIRRLNKRVYIPLPDAEARRYLFRHEAEGMPPVYTELIETMVEQTVNYSCDDVSKLINEMREIPFTKICKAHYFVHDPDAATYTVSEESNPDAVYLTDGDDREPGTRIVLPETTQTDLERVLATFKPSTVLTDLERYEEFTRTKGRMG